jgi:hypothetical protein
MKLHRTASAMLALALFAPACAKKEKQAPPPQQTTQAAAPEGVDAELWNDLKALSTECAVDPKSSNVTCQQGEKRKLIGDFLRGQRERPPAVATLARALSDKDESMSTVAAHVLYSAFRTNFGTNVELGAVQAKDAKALIDAMAKAPAAQARQAAPATVHAAMLARQADALYAVLDAPDNEQLAGVAYRYVMTHGRLEAFDKVKALLKDQRMPVVLAALEAPRSMARWTEQEQAALCPWAKELLTDERPAVAAKAAGLLGSCQGEYVEALVAEGERLLKEKKLTAVHLAAFRDLCSPRRKDRNEAPSDAVCDRNRKLLEAVLADASLDARTRSVALTAIAAQWPDDKSKKLAKKYEQDKDAQLAQTAQRAIQRIERGPGGPPHGRPGMPPFPVPRPSPGSAPVSVPPAAPPAAPKQ